MGRSQPVGTGRKSHRTACVGSQAPWRQRQRAGKRSLFVLTKLLQVIAGLQPGLLNNPHVALLPGSGVREKLCSSVRKLTAGALARCSGFLCLLTSVQKAHCYAQGREKQYATGSCIILEYAILIQRALFETCHRQIQNMLPLCWYLFNLVCKTSWRT